MVPGDNLKQVIVMRTDLNMRKGKMVVQGSHASSRIATECERNWDPDWGYTGENANRFQQWSQGLEKKICVGVGSEQELKSICAQAEAAGLLFELVLDAGLTEFKEPTYTCCAIGPAEEDVINKITGHLKLL